MSGFFSKLKRGKRQANKNSKIKPKNLHCNIKTKMSLDAISGIQNCYAKDNVAHSDSDISF